MKNKPTNVMLIVSCLYFLLSALYLYWPSWINTSLRPYEKALPILLLAGFLGWSGRGKARLPVTALVLSAAGDITGDSGAAGFIPSIAFFGLAQVLYAVYFAQTMRFRVSRLVLALLYLAGISILVFNLSGSPILADPILRIMVMAYTAVISAMAITALFRDKCSLLLPLGAIIFTLSDSMIAWDRFISPFPNAGIWVMVTYALAQYLITVGIETTQP